MEAILDPTPTPSLLQRYLDETAGQENAARSAAVTVGHTSLLSLAVGSLGSVHDAAARERLQMGQSSQVVAQKIGRRLGK